MSIHVHHPRLSVEWSQAAAATTTTSVERWHRLLSEPVKLVLQAVVLMTTHAAMVTLLCQTILIFESILVYYHYNLRVCQFKFDEYLSTLRKFRKLAITHNQQFFFFLNGERILTVERFL